jgi:uncharacterized NAD-dependent epimerase/dehydratase family protein
MLGRPRRLVLLAEGAFTPLDAKTAVGVLRYRAADVAAVLDSTRAGRTAAACVGVGGAVSVVATLDAAAAAGGDSLLIGVAPQGGALPPAWRALVRDALARGWDVLSGLHVFLADDPELAAAAAAGGARIVDVRRPPAERTVGAGRASRAGAVVALTVGSDCNVGKMTASLEIVAALRAAGVRAAFVATGQTGIFIAGSGAVVDAIPSDFVAGAVENLVLEAARDAEVVVVEGQGSIHHPGYSGVTLGLMHGAAPEALILCHREGHERIRAGAAGDPVWPVPPLAELIRDNEAAAAWVRPAPVVGVALNTYGLAEPAARAACERAARETGRPATDPVRFGAAALAAALKERIQVVAPGPTRAPGARGTA